MSSTALTTTPNKGRAANAQLQVAAANGAAVLQLSGHDYRHRQELINQHHSRGLQVNMAATYVMALKYKQLDERFSASEEEILTLKQDVQEQQQQVGSITDSIGNIEEQIRSQNEKMSELQNEVAEVTSTHNEAVEKYEGVLKQQAELLEKQRDQLYSLMISNVTHDCVVDGFLGLFATLSSAAVTRLPMMILSWVVRSLPLKPGIRATILRVIGRLMLIVQLFSLHQIFRYTRNKCILMNWHSGAGSLVNYYRMLKHYWNKRNNSSATFTLAS